MRQTTFAFVAVLTCAFLPATTLAYTIDCRQYAEPTLREGALLAAASPGPVAVAGDLACVVDGNQLLVVGVANPDAPVVRGVWSPAPGETIGAVVMGADWAVVLLAPNRLVQLDLRNPGAPTAVLPAYVAGGAVGRLAAAGSRVCAQVGDSGLLVLARLDGLPLALVGSLTLPGAVHGLATGPQYAYLTHSNSQLTTVAIAGAPTVVHDAECYSGRNLALAGGRLLADRQDSAVDGDNQPYSWRQADSFSLANPAAPALIGSLSLPADQALIAGTANAALFWFPGDLLALEVAPLKVAGALSNPASVSAAAAGDDVAVAATSDGFRFYAAATPVNAGPQQMFFEVGAHPWQYAAGGHWLAAGRGYWGGFSGGIRWQAQLMATDLITGQEHHVFMIISTSEGAVPVPVAVSDDLVVYEADGLRVMDVTAESFAGNSSVLLPSGPGLAAIGGQRVIVADATQLTLWDCSDPAAAVVVDQWPLDALPRAIATAYGGWGTVLLAYDDGRLQVRELGDIESIATYQLPQPANAMAVHGSRVICGTDAGLLAVNAFNIPDLDKDLGDVVTLASTEAPVLDLAMDGYNLYASLGALGQRVYQVTNTAANLLATGGPRSTRVDLVTTSGNQLAFVAARDGLAAAIGVECRGTDTRDLQLAALQVTGAAPNPFNPRTTIHFTLDRDQQVHLALFDARGRLVRTLMQGPAGEGRHAAAWDGRDDRGRDCAAGVYLARLHGEQSTSTAKLMLVR